MTHATAAELDHLRRFGYAVLRSVFSTAEIEAVADRLSAALQDRREDSVLRSRGQTYGSRNLLEVFPEVLRLPQRPALCALVTTVLGRNAGIVRVLYFDKPPGRSWSLPWHQDRTIAVKRNDLPSTKFGKPTFKAGVPHVEAPVSLLENMLTLRIHLDPMTADNGPLSVIPGSHRADRSAERPPVELHVAAGDVLAMRPLLSHSSSVSRPGTCLHRRIIHVECGPGAELPDDYHWHTFLPLGDAETAEATVT